jgi:hypothetical protein
MLQQRASTLSRKKSKNFMKKSRNSHDSDEVISLSTPQRKVGFSILANLNQAIDYLYSNHTSFNGMISFMCFVCFFLNRDLLNYQPIFFISPFFSGKFSNIIRISLKKTIRNCILWIITGWDRYWEIQANQLTNQPNWQKKKKKYSKRYTPILMVE